VNRVKADKFFRTEPEKLNCAQCILKAFQAQLNISDSIIAEFRRYGGGRAPEGVCGALYAADYLLKQHGKNSIQEEFRQKTNAVTCLELRKKRKVLCEMYINIVDELLEQKLNSF